MNGREGECRLGCGAMVLGYEDRFVGVGCRVAFGGLIEAVWGFRFGWIELIGGVMWGGWVLWWISWIGMEIGRDGN